MVILLEILLWGLSCWKWSSHIFEQAWYLFLLVKIPGTIKDFDQMDEPWLTTKLVTFVINKLSLC